MGILELNPTSSWPGDTDLWLFVVQKPLGQQTGQEDHGGVGKAEGNTGCVTSESEDHHPGFLFCKGFSESVHFYSYLS